MGSKVTLQMLAGLARGNKGGKIDVKVKTGGRGRGRTTKQTQELDLETICGGPVELSGPVRCLVLFLCLECTEPKIYRTPNA
jgi:hypothetical protein